MSEQYREDTGHIVNDLPDIGIDTSLTQPLAAGEKVDQPFAFDIDTTATCAVNPFTFAASAEPAYPGRWGIPPKSSTPLYASTTPPLTEERLAEIVRKVVQEVLYPDVNEQVTDAQRYRRVVLYEEDGTAWQGMLYLKSRE